MRKITIYLLLSLALVLGFATRFYLLGEAPAGLYLDEAAQGYNAYSILLTGKDEFGKSFPIVFRSFTDFKTPIYIYILVPLIKLFGLSKFTVRLPSFIFSLLTFPFLYLLIKQVSPKKIAERLAIITTLLLAISPWHVLFGRTNFETNVALFFLIAATYLLYKSIKNPKLIPLSALLIALALPAYHSQRIVAPAVLLAILIRHKKAFLSQSHRNYLLAGGLIGLVITLPTLLVATTPGFLARASLNIFNFEKTPPAGLLSDYSGIVGWLINHPFYLSTKEFLGLYLSYFSPRNMFVLGDYGPRSSFPALSTFFIWQFPFYLFGFWELLKNKSLKEIRFLTIVFLLVSPIPAALTRDPYSTIRSEPLVIPQLIIISIGLIVAFGYLRLKPLKIAFLLLVPFVLAYSLAKLHSSAIVLNEHYRASYWNYGWEEVAKTIKDVDLPIVVDNARTEPYSQLLFFLEYDPQTYQNDNFEVPLSEYYTNMERNHTKTIGNIVTRQINWESDIYTSQYLVGDELTISEAQIKEHKLEVVRDITYPDWSLAFRIVKTNPEEKCLATFNQSSSCQN